MKDDRENCLSAGMDDYISKPIRLASVREVLLNILKERKSYPEWEKTKPPRSEETA